MGKKYVAVERRNKRYKIYACDLKEVHQSIRRTIPAIPTYSGFCLPLDGFTDESAHE